MIATQNFWNTSGRFLVATGFSEMFFALILCIPAADYYTEYKKLPLFMIATWFAAYVQWIIGLALISSFPYTLEEDYHDTD